MRSEASSGSSPYCFAPCVQAARTLTSQLLDEGEDEEQLPSPCPAAPAKAMCVYTPGDRDTLGDECFSQRLDMETANCPPSLEFQVLISAELRHDSSL